jgi:hypothetical protein
MLTLFRDSVHPIPPLLPPAAPGPDYAALVDILIDLQPPDNAGEIVINAEEAARLRAAGWSARKGPWRSPTIPPEFLALYPPLWHLRDDIDPASRPILWHPKRATFIRPQISSDYLSRRERQLLCLIVRNGRLSRTQLQQRVSYLVPVSIFNFLLQRLLTQQVITINDGWIYPCETRRTAPGL